MSFHRIAVFQPMALLIDGTEVEQTVGDRSFSNSTSSNGGSVVEPAFCRNCVAGRWSILHDGNRPPAGDNR